MLVHSCLFVLLSLLPLVVYICTVLFEQINDDGGLGEATVELQAF